MHQSTCNIPIYPFRLITTLRFSKSNSIYRNYSFGFYSRFLISNHLKYISNFHSKVDFISGSQTKFFGNFNSKTLQSIQTSMQPNIVLPIGKANGTHLATRYINVHLPHIGAGYTDDAPPTHGEHTPPSHPYF